VLTALLIMLREGFEAALFLIAAATTQDGWAVLVGGLAGLAAAISARSGTTSTT
jgi:high-affinity Fe2+/Pb2+ permease